MGNSSIFEVINAARHGNGFIPGITQVDHEEDCEDRGGGQNGKESMPMSLGSTSS